jgi:5-methyltetrahydrofolate--homocysteine methyltransferase
MPNMRAVVAAIKAADVNARVMIGGAPTTPEFAKQIGADGFAPDAGAAVDLAKQLLAAG